MTPSYMKTKSRQVPWRIVLPVLLLLVLLVGGFLLVRRVLYVRELANEKAQFDQYGVPALQGPISPGGPLFGKGALADLDVSDNGWNERQNPDGTTTNTIFVTVHNNSERTWNHVQVVVDLFGNSGKVGTQRGDVRHPSARAG